VTVTRAYYCNLCGSNGAAEPLRGIYWRQEATKECMVEKPMRAVEHHICEKCLADLRSFPVNPEAKE
jgi:hypothetical protein